MNVTVYTEGTGVISDEKLSALVQEHFDLRPKGIIQMLDLLRPIYRKTAAYGHFGRDEPEFSWENVDRVDALRDATGVKGKVEMHTNYALEQHELDEGFILACQAHPVTREIELTYDSR